MASHERATETDNHGRPYCSACGMLEAQWSLKECDGRPVLSVVPPAELTEVESFMKDPLAWLQEWNEKNGKVEHYFSPGNSTDYGVALPAGYVVLLWVEDQTRPISTGVAPTLTHAFQNAIKGLDGLRFIS